MTKEEIRKRYSRIPTDFSQIEMLKKQFLDAGLIDVAQVSIENAGKALMFSEDGTLIAGDASELDAVTSCYYANTTIEHLTSDQIEEMVSGRYAFFAQCSDAELQNVTRVYFISKSSYNVELFSLVNVNVVKFVYEKVNDTWSYSESLSYNLNVAQIANAVDYMTSEPYEANTEGLKFVVLTSEPTARFDGYIYIITEA